MGSPQQILVRGSATRNCESQKETWTTKKESRWCSQLRLLRGGSNLIKKVLQIEKIALAKEHKWTPVTSTSAASSVPAHGTWAIRPGPVTCCNNTFCFLKKSSMFTSFLEIKNFSEPSFWLNHPAVAPTNLHTSTSHIAVRWWWWKWYATELWRSVKGTRNHPPHAITQVCKSKSASWLYDKQGTVT